jgi:hypothetical protein
MTAPRFNSFDEFWPFYVREHSRKTTRVLHFIGTSAALTAAAAGLLTRKKWLLALAPVVGYGPAWIGHFFVERNRPATFSYPAWSLRADLIMFVKMLGGSMDAEVERVMREHEHAPQRHSPNANGAKGANGNGSNGRHHVEVDFGAAPETGEPIDPKTLN